MRTWFKPSFEGSKDSSGLSHIRNRTSFVSGLLSKQMCHEVEIGVHAVTAGGFNYGIWSNHTQIWSVEVYRHSAGIGKLS